MLGNRENPIEDIKNKLTHRYSIIAIIPMTSSSNTKIIMECHHGGGGDESKRWRIINRQRIEWKNQM
jgi:protein subunit release factor A